MKLRLELVPAVLLLALCMPVAASAKIVYGCGYNVCKSGDAGGSIKKLTKDGSKTKQYIYPAVSRNGKVIVVGQDENVYVSRNGRALKSQAKTYWESLLGFTRLSADGSWIAFNEFNYGFGSLAPYTTVYASTHKGKAPSSSAHSVGVAGVGFTKDKQLMTTNGFGTTICAYSKTARACIAGRELAKMPADLAAQGYEFGPASDMSPNGKFVVTGLRGTTSAGELPAKIAIFKVADGSLVRILTSGPNDEYPSYLGSGGGKVVYECGTSICVVSAGGGRAKRIIRSGSYPTWGVG
jgi:hypothetical protein